MPNFGFVKHLDVATQQAALEKLARLAQKATVDPLVRSVAIKIVADCASRDDQCELDAVFNAVRHGDPRVGPLKKGFKYIADPRYSDYFTSPVDTLRACMRGACGGDCDDHTALIVALLGSIGWQTGLRAWGPSGGDELVHVYAVAAYPKRPPYKRAIALDTTVDDATVGWEPPKGIVLTAWID